MDLEEKYSINREILFDSLTLIDIPKVIESCTKDWQNHSLCVVNDCVVRIGVIHGEFHWHKHDKEDEFFYVIDGQLLIDFEDVSVEVNPGQGFMVPKGIQHRTRAPRRTSILMVEGSGVRATGD
ncbi:MAG: cupin domain-containing protein [Candidatus Thorarchaeota archaeon]